MPYPPDAKSYSDAEDTPPEHPPAHTAECPECQFSHQQTKTATNETRASSQQDPLLSLIFMAGTQSFNRAKEDTDKNTDCTADDEGALIDVTHSGEWIGYSPPYDSS